jgi:hypothetical protein
LLGRIEHPLTQAVVADHQLHAGIDGPLDRIPFPRDFSAQAFSDHGEHFPPSNADTPLATDVATERETVSKKALMANEIQFEPGPPRCRIDNEASD